jgi:hypothetical protein
MTTPIRAIYDEEHHTLKLLDPIEATNGEIVSVQLVEADEEITEPLSPEEAAGLETLLTDYMVDGKVNLEKLKASSRVVDLDAPVVSEKMPEKLRIAGLHKGNWWVSDDFDDELPDSFWLGEDE